LAAQAQDGAQVQGRQLQYSVMETSFVGGVPLLGRACASGLNAAAELRRARGGGYRQGMRIAGRGEIEVWEGASLWLLQAERDVAHVDAHSHHAIQITLSLDGDFELAAGEQSLSGPAVAVAADTDHVFRASGRAAFLFVEPESAAGMAIGATLFGESGLATIPAERVGPHLSALRAYLAAPGRSDAGLAELGRRIVADLAGEAPSSLLDPRVTRMIDFARANLEGTISLSDAVADIGLSPSRLRHLFVRQTGLPFKTYILWLRIQKGMEAYAGGRTLTEAAHAAGFADSAHFSRTFRRTFGLPAASLRVSKPPQATRRALSPR
jgi:AraC family transcriptional regulator